MQINVYTRGSSHIVEGNRLSVSIILGHLNFEFQLYRLTSFNGCTSTISCAIDYTCDDFSTNINFLHASLKHCFTYIRVIVQLSEQYSTNLKLLYRQPMLRQNAMIS